MILEPGMFVLVLNDMRSSNIENLSPVACARNADELEALMEGCEAPERWMDGRWGKGYMKDSPLEWFNGPFSGSNYIVQWFPNTPPDVPLASELIQDVPLDHAAADEAGVAIGSLPG